MKILQGTNDGTGGLSIAAIDGSGGSVVWRGTIHGVTQHY